ncbi:MULTISPECIES: TadE/TadG family type IV pilus assembly protein [Pseudomonas]|uniref:Flp pilus assembly pilin Flp n=1 Tax=Phytopseudomonas flavescens TaxID=29435 RepID=A0A7Y9XM62_9GAMM|nr:MULTISPECIES: TadE/TadG family type IV pilus assembly protein [Pseudomonas]MCW2291479.1 Flp pilus assembly pilin Flp [Pseudomonas sp. BIGb0408]NYH73950.1 Flp pilus assembly pilin Flp [Pseudomonas flavescens]
MNAKALLREQDGVTAVETALILPVLLFGVMMIFELARIALMIGVGSLALERSLQDFRQDRAFYQQSPETLQEAIETRLVEGSYGLLDQSDLQVELLAFDNLRQFGGGQPNAELDDGDASPQVLSVTVDMTQHFITPLPALFGLGDAFQYQYRQLLGNLTSEREAEQQER